MILGAGANFRTGRNFVSHLLDVAEMLCGHVLIRRKLAAVGSIVSEGWESIEQVERV